ncbi:TetR/AcrR family transcriptional regulator [Agromyces binzhouensis]|uniref:TetR/AcrR family transcriptional regulator n=1 Tax=Agromyces binzhouensis TaxID=1817495 RepID=A0A4Q2JQ72_9MICO|nr:TetR/AcrR family transcriptional regulator [Agromyces binzhouensis]RXZ48178.1 TetR/AcrR family transcriptional regulator [Agromyces binzhouensis]
MSESARGEGPKPRKPNLGPSAGPANRRALLAAAREIFAADGLSAPFSAIARRAGVGQGSLYRHFPDRLSLAVAVYEENLDELEAAVAPPEAGLDDLLQGVIAQAIVSTALIDLISAHPHDPRVERLGARVRDIAVAAVEHERAAGRFGEHVDVEDVLLAISMLAGLVARTEPAERAATADRAWELLHAAFTPRTA